MEAVSLEQKKGEPTTIHFKYSGECLRCGDGSAPSLENIAKSSASFLNEKLGDDKYYSKYRFVVDDDCMRSYEIRRKGLPNFLKEFLFRWGGFRLLFDSSYCDYDSAPDVIAQLDANMSAFPLYIWGNASPQEKKILEEWNNQRKG